MTGNNKGAAIAFLELASSGKVNDAYSKFVDPGFKHHNPFFEGSAESLKTGMEENARQNPNKVLEVKRAIAEGDGKVRVRATIFPDELKSREQGDAKKE